MMNKEKSHHQRRGFDDDDFIKTKERRERKEGQHNNNNTIFFSWSVVVLRSQSVLEISIPLFSLSLRPLLKLNVYGIK